MPAYYSSRVDFLDRSNPPKKLLADALIELNKPVDFTDPKTGHTYRFFQSSFDGPYLPGDAEFNKLVGTDRNRDQVYRSYLSVNYDPGRWLKYIGGVLVLLGIVIVYYFRTSTPNKPLAVSHGPPTNKSLPQILLCAAVLLFSAGNARADNAPPDWSTWQHLPAFDEGRVEPLDTFARETVEAIWAAQPRRFSRPTIRPMASRGSQRGRVALRLAGRACEVGRRAVLADRRQAVAPRHRIAAA